MLCDWNDGTPQHNFMWTLQLGSESRVTYLFKAVHQGSSNSLLVWTQNHAIEDILLPDSSLRVQSVQSLVCTELCSLPGLVYAHWVWAWSEIIDPETGRISIKEETKAECLIFDTWDRWRWVKNVRWSKPFNNNKSNFYWLQCCVLMVCINIAFVVWFCWLKSSNVTVGVESSTPK